MRLVLRKGEFIMATLRQLFGLLLGALLTGATAMAQLSGSYDIGGGNNDYPNFTSAVAALYGNGISGAVTFNVYGGDYNEQVYLHGPITGASATDTVKFRDASGTARLHLTSLLASDRGAIHDSLASYVIWDGIDIYLDQVHDSTYKCLVMRGASHCIFRNCDFRGAGYSASTVKYAVYMYLAHCDSNVFENIYFHRHNSVFKTAGSTSIKHTGNIVRNCTIDSTWAPFYLNYTPGMRVYDNDIQMTGQSTTTVYGVDVQAQASGDTVFIYRNKFHNLTFGGSSSFIHSYGGTGSVLNVYNNFFYDVETTGTASPYVVMYANTSGTTNFSFNSVYVNDVASTGSMRVIYMASSSATVNIRNNIFYSAVDSITISMFYGLSSTYLPTALDYNAYYNAAGNPNYTLFYASSGYATLAALQAATTYEDHGVEGDPGFVSASDLHILSTYDLVSNIGLPIAGIGDDIDGQARSVSNPDIGADEYTYLAPAADYAVTEMLNVTYLNAELTLKHPRARVVNRGSDAQTDVPVVLFYSGTPQDTVLVSLGVDAVDTVQFDWTTPTAPQTGTLEVQCFLTGDTILRNDSVLFSVRIVGQPMHGTYDIGGGNNNYANFSSAVDDMTLRTVDGAVIFDVYGTTYNDSLVMSPITGASATNTITFREHTGALDEPVVLTRSVGQGVVRLVGADYVTIDGIDITATGTCANAVHIYNNADHNTIKNCAVTGASVSSSSYRGIYVQAGGNDYNTFDNLTVSGAGYGIDLYAASGTVDVKNEVKNCSITQGIYGVRTYYQRGARVHDCDVQPGWSSAATTVYGLYAATQTAGDSVFYYNNKVHNLRTSSSYAATGIYTVANPALIYNNWVYDFENTGTGAVYGIYVYGNVAQVYFNSVYIGDVATTGGTSGTAHINGFFQTQSSASVTLKNNIFQIDEPTDVCYAINRNNGTLASSDFNCVYSSGPGALYNMGRDGATDYATLAAWQGGTGRDANSVEGNPGFVSATDLHIDMAYVLVDEAGTPIAGITDDIDGDLRDTVRPDIGADEYTPVSHDFGVIGFVGLLPEYVSQTPYTIQADVQNNGAANETNVPVRLYYAGVLQSTTLVTLNAGIRDTIDLAWTTPDTFYEVDTLEVQAFCPHDDTPANDSALASVTVVGPPEEVDSLTIFPDADAGDALLKWAPAAHASSYKVYRGTVYGFVVDGTTYIGQTTGTSYTDAGVLATAGSKFYVVIASTDVITR
jgi:hypothetical protein